MSKFVVSARKYRPTTFDEVVGQEHVTKTLKNALANDQLAHAFLFTGPRGVGKTTCARILAKTLNCENRTKDQEPCNTCDSCKSFNEQTSFNVTELDAASNNSVEHIRSLIEQVRFQPQQGQYKVFIIDEVHMLSTQAFNAFLKTLEEPPPYAIFILATTEKHKIIPTILSRTQIFDFKRIQVGDIAAYLEGICKKEKIKAESDALHMIAQKADGSLRDSLSIFDKIASFAGKKITYDSVIENLNILDYDYYFKVVDAFMQEDVSRVLLIFDDILKKGFEPDIFINGLAGHIRNLLISKDEATLQLLEQSESLTKSYQDQALISPTHFLLSALNIANESDVSYKMALNKRLHIEMALIKMTFINSAETAVVAASVNPNASSKKKTIEVSIPIKKEEKSEPGLKHSEDISTSNISDNNDFEKTPLSVVKDEEEIEETVEVVAFTDQSTNNFESEGKNEPEEEVTKSKKKVQPSPISDNTSSSVQEPALFSLPTLGSLDDFDKVVQEEIEEKAKNIKPVSLENVKKVWKEYAEQATSPSLKHNLLSTELSLDDQEIVAKVGSYHGKNLINNELNLMDFVRAQTRSDRLTLKVVIDEEKVAKEVAKKPPKPLTNKEKFDKLIEINPLVAELKERLNLTVDYE